MTNIAYFSSMTPEELLSSNAVAVVSSSPAPWLDILQTQFWKSWDTVENVKQNAITELMNPYFIQSST